MEQIFAGIAVAFKLQSILLILLGTVVGIIFGAVPGLSSIMAIALFLPFTFGMDPVSSMSLLLGLYIGAVSGGLISAILLNIPGTANSIATCFDGNPMAKRGEAGRAIANGILYSFLGGMASFLVLIFISPPLSRFAIRFTPFDYFAIVVFSLTMMASLSGRSMAKGLLSGLLGMSLTFVGIAPIDAIKRFTFGSIQLGGGFELLSFMLGIFAVTEIIDYAEKVGSEGAITMITNRLDNLWPTMRDFTDQWWNFVRSSVIGIAIGILPGIGGGVANLISYSVARDRSRHPEKFGTGILDGVVASEAANNACIGGAMVPLLSLGIPGDATTALLIGGFMIHGITPGPQLMLQNASLVYAIFTILILANICMLVVEFSALKLFIKMFNIPKNILLPMIMTLCLIGAFGANNRVFDMIMVFFIGVLGYLFKKFGYPPAPMVIGFVLCRLLEENFRRGLMYSRGSLLPFFTQPMCAVLLILAAVSVFLSVRRNLRLNRAAIKE